MDGKTEQIQNRFRTNSEQIQNRFRTQTGLGRDRRGEGGGGGAAAGRRRSGGGEEEKQGEAADNGSAHFPPNRQRVRALV